MVLHCLNGFCSVYRIVESTVYLFDSSSAVQVRVQLDSVAPLIFRALESDRTS